MDLGSFRAEKSEEYARNTAFFLFNFLTQSGKYDQFIDLVLKLLDGAALKLDPLEEPLIETFELIQRGRMVGAQRAKVRGRLEFFRREIARKGNWCDTSARARVAATLDRALEQLKSNS
jgi:hypothetical protein